MYQRFIKHAGLQDKTYQRLGIEWCVQRERQQPSGGILADDMGLGKTITMIATMLCNFVPSTLIILPVALMQQWTEQIYNTTGHQPLVYHGQDKKHIVYDDLINAPIVITTYGQIIQDSKSTRHLFKKWDRIICDEAHHLRNNKTKLFQVMSSLKTTTFWFVTGTPIQNHLNDLYSLLCLMGYSPIEYTNSEKLREIVRTVILKRTKNDVGLNLPKLYTTKIITKWENSKEMGMCQDIHEACNFSSLQKHKIIDPQMILAVMTFARQACVYPQMVKKHMLKMKSMGLISKDNYGGEQFNSKMNRVIQMIVERKDNGNKKIIFTTFREESAYLKEKLQAHGFLVDMIDGSVPKGKRNEILNSELDVLILQIRSGNEGLNLQQYNEIYLNTPDWNPKVEDQAIARSHRFGQQKEVFVFRFIMERFDNQELSKNIEMHTQTLQDVKREYDQVITN
jgi:transcription termination factor 2